MFWTYRVRKRIVNATEVEFGIVEFYTSDAGAGGWTENCIAPIALIESTDAGDTDKAAIDELRWHLTEMLKALDKPIIKEIEK
jgi:hypothetical protein